MADLVSSPITFLFTDLVGSTELWEEHPQAMGPALARHDLIVREAVAEHGGRVLNTGGDAFSVAFDRAGPAVLAAVKAQRRLLAQDWGELGALEARMALHTGPAQAREGNYFGQSLNRCARLLDAAHGRQIVITGASAEALRADAAGPILGFALEDLGRHRLRDLREPEQVYQVQHPDLPTDFPRLRSLDSLPNNLPIQLTRFIGRDEAMEAVARLLDESRLVTLIGTGGCGKTRLALQVAARRTDAYRDGAWLIELAAVTDPDLVVQAVARTLGVREPRRVGPRRADSPAVADGWRDRLGAYLEPREMLLVLDNCEHLIGACAQLAEHLLRRCPGLRILATSREALGIPGESTYHVPSLALPPAPTIDAEDGDGGLDTTYDLEALEGYESVRLFLHRARKVKPDFALSQANAGAVIQICRRLDGIPLAIELAAGRIKLLPPDEIARRIDDRFRLLTGGSRTALPRQQTLRATMDWSYELLGDNERALWRRLSVFAQGFTMEAAESVCSDEADGGSIGGQSVLDLLTQLIDKSLVLVDSSTLRYRLLQTVQQYGRERLADAGEAAAFRNRHRNWYLGLARDAGPRLQGADQAIWLDRLGQEHGNLRSAIEWSIACKDTEAGLELTGSLWWFWFVRGYLAEGRAWLERALASGRSDEVSGGRARALLGAGALAWRRRDYQRAGEHLSAALEAFQTLGDELGVARVLHFQGRVSQYRGDYAAAMRAYEASLAISRALDDAWGVASTLDIMGLTAWHQGDLEHATTWLQQSLEIARELGDLRGIADSLNILGRVAHDRGEFDRASELYQDSLEVFRALGDEVNVAYGYNKLGNVARHRGEYAEAELLLHESLERCRALGERRGVAYALSGLGNLARSRGDLDEAGARFGESLRMAREIGDKRGIADALRNLGWLAEEAGRPDRAFVLLHESLERYVEMGDRLGIAESLSGIAGSLRQADPERAARLYAASDGMRAAIGAPLPRLQAASRDRDLAALREQMGEEAFEQAIAEGSAIEAELAIRLAREHLAGIPLG